MAFSVAFLILWPSLSHLLFGTCEKNHIISNMNCGTSALHSEAMMSKAMDGPENRGEEGPEIINAEVQ